MRFLALAHLYRIRLRSRLGTELLALAGIAVGVALVFAALVANASLTGAVRELSEEIAGRADFQLSARSASGFDQAVLRRVRRVRGARAAPVVEARVNLAGPGGRRSVLLVGGDPRLRGRRGLFLPPPVADDLGLGAGEVVTVETGLRTARAPLAATLGVDQFGVLAESPVALAPLSQARRLIGMRGRVSRIFIDAAPGREAAVGAALRRPSQPGCRQSASHLFFDTVPGYLTSAFAIGSQRIVAWQSVALAAGSGVLASCLAVLSPLWSAFAAGGARPARREPTKQWLEGIGGFACLGSALALVALAPAFSLVGMGALLLALLLLSGCAGSSGLRGRLPSPAQLRRDPDGAGVALRERVHPHPRARGDGSRRGLRDGLDRGCAG